MTPVEPERLLAASTQLVLVHADLRERLEDLLDALDDVAAGTAPPTSPTLLEHCTTFCSTLERHHTGEDGDAFPALAQEVPELVPVLAKLRSDHSVVSHVLGTVQRLVDDLRPETVPEVREHLVGLAAVLETHFRYEERQLSDALDRLGFQIA